MKMYRFWKKYQNDKLCVYEVNTNSTQTVGMCIMTLPIPYITQTVGMCIVTTIFYKIS